MDSKDTDNETPKLKSSAERVRKHRKRQRQLELQVAYGIAKIVTGKGAGDQANAVAAHLEKIAAESSLPNDIRETLDEAIDKLRSRRRY
jgi:hypothetical protein